MIRSQNVDEVNRKQMKMDVAVGVRGRHYRKVVVRKTSSFGVLPWLLFFLSVAAWGGIFGTVLGNAENEFDHAEKQISLSITRGEKSVLGVTNKPGETGSVQQVQNDAFLLTDIAEQVAEADELAAQKIQSVVDEIEEERKDKLRKILSLKLPHEIDNPIFPVTFVEPAGSEVEIQVDGEGFAVAMSPYSLPSLSIGEHVIDFRFQDSEGVSQNLEETFIIIPRPPVWKEGQKTEFSSDSVVILGGTALPNSRVIVLISETLKSAVAEVDGEGIWNVSFDKQLETGKYSAISFVRKSGYASNFSEVKTFSVGMVEGVSDTMVDEDVVNEKEVDLLFGLIPYTEENYPYVIAIIGLSAIVVVLVMSAIFKSIGAARRESAGWVAKQQNGTDERSKASETLREKFRKAGIGVGNGVQKSILKETQTVRKSMKKEEDDDERTDEEQENTEDEMRTEETQKTKEYNEEKAPHREVDEVSEGTPEEKELDEQPKKGKIYSKCEFLKKFGKSSTSSNKETNKIRISLTSNKGK